MKKIIGIIGYGNMGSAIAERLKKEFAVFIFDKDKNKTAHLSEINVAEDSAGLADKSDIIILAVKPQDFENLLNEIKDYAADKLMVSIAAGITTSYIENRLKGAKVIRLMPNLPLKIGQGMTCLCKGRLASEEDLAFVQGLFNKLGKTLILNEEMMDAATAISGSGPGFFYYLSEGRKRADLKSFAEDFFAYVLGLSAENLGFTKEQSEILARQTAEGSLAYLEYTNLPLDELLKQVASKGGTTEAGIEVLDRIGTLDEAVNAALKRAKELSRS